MSSGYASRGIYLIFGTCKIKPVEQHDQTATCLTLHVCDCVATGETYENVNRKWSLAMRWAPCCSYVYAYSTNWKLHLFIHQILQLAVLPTYWIWVNYEIRLLQMWIPKIHRKIIILYTKCKVVAPSVLPTPLQTTMCDIQTHANYTSHQLRWIGNTRSHQEKGLSD